MNWRLLERQSVLVTAWPTAPDCFYMFEMRSHIPTRPQSPMVGLELLTLLPPLPEGFGLQAFAAMPNSGMDGD